MDSEMDIIREFMVLGFMISRSCFESLGTQNMPTASSKSLSDAFIKEQAPNVSHLSTSFKNSSFEQCILAPREGGQFSGLNRKHSGSSYAHFIKGFKNSRGSKLGGFSHFTRDA